MHDIGILSLWAGHPGDAIRFCEEARALEPDLVFPHQCLVRAHEAVGDPNAAVRFARDALRLSIGDAAGDSLLGLPPAAALARYREDEIDRLERLRESSAPVTYRIACPARRTLPGR